MHHGTQGPKVVHKVPSYGWTSAQGQADWKWHIAANCASCAGGLNKMMPIWSIVPSVQFYNLPSEIQTTAMLIYPDQPEMKIQETFMSNKFHV